MNFSIQNFDTIITHIKDTTDDIIKKLTNLSELCNNSANVYMCENPDMANEYSRVENAINDASSKFSNKINKLINELIMYKVNTIENEAETNAKINSTVQKLKTIIEKTNLK